jgi:ribose transport system ATP-binding protein
VSRRERDVDGTRYDLVCGQGRIEAYLALGGSTIPAVVIDACREDQFLMSLVENVARRPPSNRDLVREVRSLRERSYKPEEIARKLGLDRAYLQGIIHLVEHGEEMLIEAVEGGRLPISVAIQIAKGTNHEMQLALSEAYEKGDLRGTKLLTAKRMQNLASRRFHTAEFCNIGNAFGLIFGTCCGTLIVAHPMRWMGAHRGHATMTDLLRVENVSKRYGGMHALRNAHFTLQAGEVHALMGENGAGKSTLAKIIVGAVRADRCDFLIAGRPVLIHSSLDAQRLGIAIIYQELDLFPDLTVGENMVVGNLRFQDSPLVSFARIERFCQPYLEQVGLTRNTREPVVNLSIAEMQLLAIARVLSVNARIILMDEPTSSLFEEGVERLFRLIAALKARGVAIVYVSHKMDEIFRICDRVTVLRDGETMGTRDVAATSSDEVIRMMVGRELETAAAAHAARTSTGDVLLSVENLTTRKLTNISFELRRGEVLGIAGLVGSGRSELGAALFGIDKISSGTVCLSGRRVAASSTSDAMRAGIGLVPEDRKLQGLMMQMSVLENSTLSALSRMQRFGFVRRRQEETAAGTIHRSLLLKSPSSDAPVSALSGGNQQKVLLSRWLLLNPDVLFLDDPARGIDVGAKQDIYRIIDELAAAEKGVILVSSELPELLRCSDRILVLNNGCLAAIYERADATPERIMTAATSETNSRTAL